MLPQDTAHLIKDHVTNEEVFAKIQQTIGLHEDLTIANRSKLKGCGHVSCSLGLAKTILQGSDRGKKTGKTEEKMGRQHQGRDRPGVRQIAKDSGEQKRQQRQQKMEGTGCEVLCVAPTTIALRG